MRTHTFFQASILAGLLLVSTAASSDTATTGMYTMTSFNYASGVITAVACAAGASPMSFLYTADTAAVFSVDGDARANASVCDAYADVWDMAVRQRAGTGTFSVLLSKLADGKCDTQMTWIPGNPYFPVVSIAPVRH